MIRCLNVAILIAFSIVKTIGQDTTGINEKLLIASYDGDSAGVKNLISRGANVNEKTHEGFTPLMFACQSGYTRIAEMLIQRGAEINAKASGGLSSLILSVLGGYIETAEFLIRKGADINQPDSRGVTPLMYAIQVDSFYLADLLLYYNADVTKKDNNQTDALMMACLYNRFEIAVRLLEAGADINSSDSDGNTPLHYATSAGNRKIMDLLVINGALVDKKNNSGYTPLSTAVSLNHYDEALLLISYGADVNSRIRPTLNPLTLAVNNGNDSLERLLKVQGAELINRPDFSLISASGGFAFNQQDSRLMLQFGLSDRRFYWMPSLIYGFRPSDVKVLEAKDSIISYQYRERRHFVGLGISKAFFVKKEKWGLVTAAYAGLSGVYTFGSYVGSSGNPKPRLLFKPEAGIMFEYHPVRLRIGYEWLDLHLKYYGDSWITFSIHYLMNSRKRNVIP